MASSGAWIRPRAAHCNRERDRLIAPLNKEVNIIRETVVQYEATIKRLERRIETLEIEYLCMTSFGSELTWDRAIAISDDKPTFYEQVTGVKVCSLLFPS